MEAIDRVDDKADSKTGNKGLVLRIVFKEDLPKRVPKDSKMVELHKNVLLSSVARVLYSVELVHDFWLLSSVDTYRNYRFSRYFWMGGRVHQQDKLRLIKLKKASPLEVILAVSATALPTIKLFIGSLLSAYKDWSEIKHDSQMKLLEEEKSRAELEKLKISVETQRVQLAREQFKLLTEVDSYLRQIRTREDDGEESAKIFSSLQKRLKETGFRVVEVTISDE